MAKEYKKCIIHDREIEFHNLGSKINTAFVQLCSAFLGSETLNWSGFEEASIKFFDTAIDNNKKQDYYFTNVVQILIHLFKNERWNDAEKLLQNVTEIALEWEGNNKGQFIHKGTPFYFLGMIATAQGNLDLGYLLMHQAVEEDKRTTKKESPPDLPAKHFITLNYKEAHYFQEYVKKQSEFLDNILKKYRNSYSKTLDLNGLRNQFLTQQDRLEETYMFVYTLARLMNIDQKAGYALCGQFAGQLEINILFDLTVLTEILIRNKSGDDGLFKKQIFQLAQRSHLIISLQDLTQINNDSFNDFKTTLNNILSGLYQLNGSTLTGLEADISISYLIRNHAAHNVDSVSAIWKNFNDIRQSLFNTFFLTIETFYT